jgi:serine/threonine protein kinase
VAIKILPELFAADADRLARFEREARLLASLNHPNIAAIYGFEDASSQRALALELVEGETLAEKLQGLGARGLGATGGSTVEVMRTASLGGSHRWPQFLPDGRHFIFYVGLGPLENSGIYIGSLDNGETHRSWRQTPPAGFLHRACCSRPTRTCPSLGNSIPLEAS